MRTLSVKWVFLAWALSSSVSFAKGTLLFMTDFGLRDDSIAVCKGVMLAIQPELRIIDITHDVPKFSVRDGGRFLAGTSAQFGAGAVFVAVIDPGVGSSRKAIVGKSKRGQFFVVPDNGLLTYIEERDGLEGVREIKNPAWVKNLESATFAGRDVFSPVGAHLASGEEWTEVGPVLKEWARIAIPRPEKACDKLTGLVLSIEHPYGNLVTNLPRPLFSELGYSRGDTVLFKIGKRNLKLPWVTTFSDVPKGKPLAYLDSRGHLGFAINQGDFATTYGVRPDDLISVAATAAVNSKCQK